MSEVGELWRRTTGHHSSRDLYLLDCRVDLVMEVYPLSIPLSNAL